MTEQSHSGTPPLPPTHAALQHRIVEEVVEDVDRYLSVWVRRIETMLAEQADQWARIEETQRHLTAAWEELETEQRELHRMRLAMDQRPGRAASAGSTLRRQPVELVSGPAVGADEFAEDAAQRDHRVRQFQQLKREWRTP